MGSRAHQCLPVVILCGGQSTRMRGDTPTKKEMVEVGGRPIIWHVMKIFAAFGHTRFVLTLGHQGDPLKRYFAEYKTLSHDFTVRLGHSQGIRYHGTAGQEEWEVTLVDTGLHTEKGGRIARIAPYVGKDTFFVTYADGVGNIDVDALLAFHRAHGKLATLTGVQARWQYGVVHTDENDVVTRFDQKPKLEHWVNGGFMVFEPAVFDYLSGGDDVHLERDTLPALAADGQLMMYRHRGFWRSMDTFKEAQELDTIWSQSAPWKVWQD